MSAKLSGEVIFKVTFDQHGFPIGMYTTAAIIHMCAEQIHAIRDKVMKAMLKKESLLVRKKTIPRVIDKIMGFISTYIDGIAA